MPNTSLEDAFNSAERIMVLIEQYDFHIDQAITVSIGVAQYESNQPIHDFIKRVDFALNQAKISGRNQTRKVLS